MSPNLILRLCKKAVKCLVSALFLKFILSQLIQTYNRVTITRAFEEQSTTGKLRSQNFPKFQNSLVNMPRSPSGTQSTPSLPYSLASTITRKVMHLNRVSNF